jgi:hypothetical protein
MKVIPVSEAASQLANLITDAVNGEAIFLTNGASQVQLTPRGSEEMQIDWDSPELKAALRLGLEGTPEPYSPEELDRACREALRKRKAS